MMARRLSVLSALFLFFAVPLTWAKAALAAGDPEFADRGTFILGVERIMPLVSYEDVKASQNGASSSTSITSFSLVTHGAAATLYNIPRFAIDYTVIPKLTLGGSVYVYTQVGNSTTTTAQNGVQTTTDNGKTTFWGFAPRVGYVINLSDVVAFWPRGGFSFNDANHGSSVVNGTPVGSASATQFALDLEPTFVFIPVQHVGITASAVVDIPLTGSVDVPVGNNLTTSLDLTELHIGAHVGLLVYF
jgi:hypothetical protein